MLIARQEWVGKCAAVLKLKSALWILLLEIQSVRAYIDLERSVRIGTEQSTDFTQKHLQYSWRPNGVFGGLGNI